MAFFLHYAVSPAVQTKLNVELLVQRLKLKREGSKLWDKIIMCMANLTALVLMHITAGLVSGRFSWLSLDIHFAAVGFFVYCLFDSD